MFRFNNIENLIWLITVLLAGLLFLYSSYRKKKELERFVDLSLQSYLTSDFSQIRRRIKQTLVVISMIFLVLTLMRPQGNPVETTVMKRGRDLVFVIDVSRSMLAEDLKPNRLGRAIQLVSNVIDVIEGDRVGLLVFAGSTAVKCPLTLDYNYFKNVLQRIGPQDVSRGGSLIGDAIRTVSERLFYDQDNKYRDIIIITDGEDHESFPVEAAQGAAKRGIRIHTIGLGDIDGSNIPIRESGTYNLLKYKDQTVNSRLDETTLKEIAKVSQGIFVPVRTNLVDLAGLYQDYIAVEEKRETESRESKIWSELFQFFLGITIVLLMIEALIGERAIFPIRSV
jgi:Ca-activated chloride channel homolog